MITSTGRRGAEVFAMALADALPPDRFAVSTVALVADHGHETLPVPSLGARRLGLATLRALRARSRDADVVVAHGSTTLPASVLAAIGSRTPVVYRSIGDLATWNADRVRRWRTRVLLGRAAVVVALADRAVPGVMAFGVPRERIAVIANGVPSDDAPIIDADTQARLRAELGAPAGPVVAFVGALEPEKDATTAIEAVARMDDAFLLVAGEGSEEDALLSLADRVAPGKVKFLGRVPSSTPVLGASDVVVLPSRTEGVPAVAIEAGLAGRPTVASAVGYVDEVIVDGETGLLVTPGDIDGFAGALTRAIASRDTLGVAAAARCRSRFSMDAVAPAWAELLTRVAAGAGAA